MNRHNYITKKQKFEHLNYNDLRYIEREYNNFIKTKTKTTSKTEFMKKLASNVNTCLSNLYKVIKAGMFELLPTFAVVML